MSLKTRVDGARDPGDDPAPPAGMGFSPRAASDGLPLLGMFAVGFGLLGIFTIAPVFVPLALLFGVLAIFVGQFLWGLTAVLLALAGVVSSPTLMFVLGLGVLASWLGIPLPF